MRPTSADLTGGRQGRASYTEVVRSIVNAPHQAPAAALLHANNHTLPLCSCISSSDATAGRHIHSGVKPNPRKILRPRQPHTMPAASPELEPGWTPAKRRKSLPRRASPPPQRRNERQDRHRGAPSRRSMSTALQAFITATASRCFNYLVRDHWVPQCRELVCCFLCRHSGHRALSCREPPRQPARSRAPPPLPPPSLPPPPPPPPSPPPLPPPMAIGDPHMRPYEETVFVSESFNLTRDAKDWAD